VPARARALAQLRPAARRRRGRPGGAALHQPAAGRVPRRRRRALFTNTLDWDAHPTSQGMRGLRCRRTSSSGATARCCSSCPATHAPGTPACRTGEAATTATTGRSASRSKAWRADLRGRAVPRAGAAVARVVTRYPIVRGRRPRARGTRPQARPGCPGFDWQRLAAGLNPRGRADRIAPRGACGGAAKAAREQRCGPLRRRAAPPGWRLDHEAVHPYG
jgi:hypothetical protein